MEAAAVVTSTALKSRGASLAAGSWHSALQQSAWWFRVGHVQPAQHLLTHVQTCCAAPPWVLSTNPSASPCPPPRHAAHWACPAAPVSAACAPDGPCGSSMGLAGRSWEAADVKEGSSGLPWISSLKGSSPAAEMRACAAPFADRQLACQLSSQLVTVQLSTMKMWTSQTKCRPSAPLAPTAAGQTARASPTRPIAGGRARAAASSPPLPVSQPLCQ